MKLLDLNQIGLQVSALGLGTVKFGRNTDIKYPAAFELPSDENCKKLLSLARDLGINLLDSAPAYGESESRLGQLIKHDRQYWKVCTKVGEIYDNQQSRYDFTPEYTETSVKQSMKRLGLDCLDLVLIHSDGNDLAIINQYGTLEKLNDLKAKGWIRGIGVSTKTVDGGLAAIEKSDIVMITYHAQYRDEEIVLDHAHQLGKGILIKKAFASGHLKQSEIEQSLQLIFSHPAKCAAVIGTINPVHLRANVENALRAIKA